MWRGLHGTRMSWGRLQQRLHAEGAPQLGTRSSSTGPGAQPKIWHSPGTGRCCENPGQQGHSCHLAAPAEQLSSPIRRASRVLQTESSIVTAEAESGAPELAAATAIVPPGASQNKQPPLSLTIVSPDTQHKHILLSLYQAGAQQLPQVLTSENQNNRPLPQKTI